MYKRSVAAPAASQENSRSTIARPAIPIAGSRAGSPSAPLMAAASADASPGATSHPLTPGHLVGQAARARRDHGTTVRHGFERHERAAFVERRVHEEVAASYHACSVASGSAPGEMHPGGEPRRGDRRDQPAAIRSVADDHPPPAPLGNRAPVIAQRRQRAQREPESPCSLRAGRRSAAPLVVSRSRPRGARARRRPAWRGASTARRSSAFGMTRTRPGHAEMSSGRRARALDRWR